MTLCIDKVIAFLSVEPATIFLDTIEQNSLSAAELVHLLPRFLHLGLYYSCNF